VFLVHVACEKEERDSKELQTIAGVMRRNLLNGKFLLVQCSLYTCMCYFLLTGLYCDHVTQCGLWSSGL
jgi:hypothetical protein